MIKIIEDLVKKVVEQIHPNKIYLFGSRAKGSARSESDIDLLIIADMAGSKHQRSLAIRKLFPNRRFSLDVLVYNQQEFEQESEIPNTIGYTVAHEGKLLYVE